MDEEDEENGGDFEECAAHDDEALHCRMEDIYPIADEEEEEGVRVQRVDRSVERRKRGTSSSDMLGETMVYSEVNPLSNMQASDKYNVSLRDPAHLGYAPSMPLSMQQQMSSSATRRVAAGHSPTVSSGVPAPRTQIAQQPQQQPQRLTAFMPASASVAMDTSMMAAQPVYMPMSSSTPLPAQYASLTASRGERYSTLGSYAQYGGYAGAADSITTSAVVDLPVGADANNFFFGPGSTQTYGQAPVLTATMPESYVQDFNTGSYLPQAMAQIPPSASSSFQQYNSNNNAFFNQGAMSMPPSMAMYGARDPYGAPMMPMQPQPYFEPAVSVAFGYQNNPGRSISNNNSSSSGSINNSGSSYPMMSGFSQNSNGGQRQYMANPYSTFGDAAAYRIQLPGAR